MAINVNVLVEQQKSLEKLARDGDSLFVYSKNLTAADNVRIIQRKPDTLNGSYYQKQNVYWIKGKIFQCNSTFDEPDVIAQEIANMMAGDDEDAKVLLKKKKTFDNGGSVAIIKKETRYLIPMFFFDVVYRNNVVDTVTVKDGACKVLVHSKLTLMVAINAIFCNPQYNLSEYDDGVIDPKHGYNFILSKTGKGTDTKYGAQPWRTSTAIEDEYLEDLPDVHKIVNVNMKRSDENLRSIIRNYALGEDIVDEPTHTAPATGTKKAATGTKKAIQQQPAPEQQPQPKVSRNLLDDIASANASDLEDLD